jgi:glutamate transport system permease protein
VTSVLIALAKNTSIAAVFGLAEATSRMRFFVNRDVADRLWIFLVFAIGYIILVEIISALSIALERRWRVVSR